MIFEPRNASAGNSRACPCQKALYDGKIERGKQLCSKRRFYSSSAPQISLYVFLIRKHMVRGIVKLVSATPTSMFGHVYKTSYAVDDRDEMTAMGWDWLAIETGMSEQNGQRGVCIGPVGFDGHAQMDRTGGAIGNSEMGEESGASTQIGPTCRRTKRPQSPTLAWVRRKRSFWKLAHIFGTLVCCVHVERYHTPHMECR